MWARYARTMLPLGNEHTNNRIERSFRSMKDLLKWSISGRVDISQAIPSLVNWAEEQLDDRYTDAQCHSVRISDPDPELAAIYKEAGQVLTYMATKQLKKTIDLMVRREDKMTVLEIGVQERLIKNNEEIIIQYETTPEA